MKGSRLIIDETTPEVKSFIFQQIQDLALFLTPKSIISVVSKNLDMEALINHEEIHNILTKPGSPFYKVIISITENSTIIEEEAISSNIFEAIVMAKTKLFNILLKIQDEVITREDREAQLIQAKNSVIH